MQATLSDSEEESEPLIRSGSLNGDPGAPTTTVVASARRDLPPNAPLSQSVSGRNVWRSDRVAAATNSGAVASSSTIAVDETDDELSRSAPPKASSSLTPRDVLRASSTDRGPVAASRRPLDDRQNPELYQRYKYYMKLRPTMVIPDHVLSSDVFVVPLLGGDDHQRHSSLTTIFSIFNTMIGSSLLSMPWAISEAGWLMGIFTMMTMLAICVYTSLLVVRHDQENGVGGKVVEFADISYKYLGRWGALLCVIASIGMLLGSLAANGIFMTNFLVNIGETVALWIHNAPLENLPIGDFWKAEYLCAIVLLLVFPLTLVRNSGFFAKLTSFGTLAVVYLILFTVYFVSDVCITASRDAASTPTPPGDVTETPPPEAAVCFAIGNGQEYEPHFFHFAGILTLSFYIHNSILAILRGQRNPANNVRDVSIAYGLVAMSYMVVGYLVYFAFADKDAIKDNFLDNIAEIDPGNIGLFAAHVLLLFQMISIFPLLAYIIRFQLFLFLFRDPYPSFWLVACLHAVVQVGCILVGIYLPNVSVVFRYVGATFGLVVVYILPVAFEVQDSRRKGRLTKTSFFFHLVLVAIGVAVFVTQFLPG